ncbi:hypothetical protein MH117_03780 [Paenibacillus sp. ACRRX]|uniref:hypothetical protein n=1 Tax=unclassified Paenibacillus TaxID=185978 RepID=UPI001EF674D4|nr:MULTISPECIES: hypothetical protein [unclassified Paenibacillus]MCG7406525.1 hypothetical protein [Paenibacillus sp. ACRRX]MDK8179557.1 hypothetical protein [Paenibacillus sp. UMB4589-SE434]
MESYTEISFYLPFFDLIDEADEASSFEELIRLFHINIDLAELYHKYLSYGEGPYSVGQGDVYVFFDKDDRESFILIDLFHDFTDQYNMVKLGVRSSIHNFREVKNVLYRIYSRAEVKSKINESNDLLKQEISDYPKVIRYGDQTYIKNIFYNTI